MITDKMIKDAADSLGVTPAHINAIREVEANGTGFLPGGQRPKILFERHVFYRQLVKARGSLFADDVKKQHPDICNTATGGYQGGAAEHERLDKAVQIDRNSALESCSWGAFQVMGYHWSLLGYPSVQKMVNAAYTEEGQLDILVRFLKANPAIVGAMKRKDWVDVARRYNGAGYKANKYDTKLEAAFAKYS